MVGSTEVKRPAKMRVDDIASSNPSRSSQTTLLVDGKNQPSDDAGLGVPGMVRQGIAKAQEKLIDLIMRNSMLSFRHSEISTRHVRIADEQIALLN